MCYSIVPIVLAYFHRRNLGAGGGTRETIAVPIFFLLEDNVLGATELKSGK